MYKYKDGTVIVFDCYFEESRRGTKYTERARRLRKQTFVDMLFDERIVLTVRQEKLRGNMKNKVLLVFMWTKKNCSS